MTFVIWKSATLFYYEIIPKVDLVGEGVTGTPYLSRIPFIIYHYVYTYAYVLFYHDCYRDAYLLRVTILCKHFYSLLNTRSINVGSVYFKWRDSVTV